MMPAFSINPRLGFYWAAINGLNQGLLIHDMTSNAFKMMKSLNYHENIELFNKYAPQIWPDRATGAFIALHEGLDAADMDKFPAHKYGDGRCTAARAKKICSEYADAGCRIDDDGPSLTKGQVTQRHEQTGYNDAGCDIWRQNYMRWLVQIDADDTSRGLFRIGADGPGSLIDANTSPYSRFARGLHHSTNKTAMYFALHPDFGRVNPIKSLSFRVVWYDNKPGSWQLSYKTVSGSESIAIDQQMSGSNKWNEQIVTISNAAMDRTYDRNSDFKITSNDSTDAVFHMIEITRN